jgi:hypothetical protein
MDGIDRCFCLAIVLAGCAPDPCSYESKCANDGPLSDQLKQSLANACNMRRSSACGAEYVDVLACQEANQVCTAAQVTDLTATAAAIQANCGTQASAFTACCSTHPGAPSPCQ